MKIGLITFLLSAAFAAAAQSNQKSRFCPASDLPPDILLTICTHERGMAPLIQPRLNFRVKTNGEAEYEVADRNGLITKSTTLSRIEMQSLKRNLAMPELLEAADDYPAVKPFTDSSMETRLSLRIEGRQKHIVLRNFLLWDREVIARYPAGIVLLMQAIEQYRDRAMGVVRKIPHYSFDTMIKYPDYSYNREIIIYADYEHRRNVLASGKVVDERDVLFDHEGTSKAEIEMRFEGTPETVDGMKRILARTSEDRFGGRGRILVRGIYQESVDPLSRDRVRTFYAREVKGIEPIDLPYQGEIELGWNYVDTIKRSSDDEELRLSAPLKMRIHHAGRIDWLNLGQFPQVMKTGMHSVVFRAGSRTTQQVEKYSWRNTFHLTILDVR
jgi:hypothetical protein